MKTFFLRASKTSWPLLLLLCAAALPVSAQTLDQQYEFYLQTVTNKCDGLSFTRDVNDTILPGQAGPNLFAYCNGPVAVGTGAGTTTTGSSGGGAGAAAGRSTESENAALRRRRECARSKQQNCTETAANGAASSDIESTPFANTNLFLSADYRHEKQSVTTYEDGHKGNRYVLTAGMDHRFGQSLLAGLALKANDLSGEFSSGGNFSTRSYGVALYGSWTPIDGLFVDMTAGGDLKHLETTRIVGRTITFLPLGQTVPQIFIDIPYTPVAGNTHARATNADMLLGYDFYFGRVTIGPRLGGDIVNNHVDGYTETGSSPMSLAFDPQKEKSLQSTVGFQASAAFTSGSKVIVPQLNANWLHEYSDDQRMLTAHFAEDLRSNPAQLHFLTQPPDRDSFIVRFSTVAVFKGGMSGFFAVEKLFGHAYRDQYGASIGVRFEL